VIEPQDELVLLAFPTHAPDPRADRLWSLECLCEELLVADIAVVAGGWLYQLTVSPHLSDADLEYLRLRGPVRVFSLLCRVFRLLEGYRPLAATARLQRRTVQQQFRRRHALKAA
jgi:hypothetical protein